MRTNIDIDDTLLVSAMEATGLSTKKATVDESLRQLVLNHWLRRTLEDMKGLGWEGDLDTIRDDWSPDRQR